MATEGLLVQVSEKGAVSVKRKIEDIGAGATKSGNSVRILKQALGGIGTALVLRGSFNLLRQFGQEMSTVRAVTGAVGAEFSALTKTARNLGATTRFTATQAAEGMTFLARAGFDANEVMASIEGTLNLAQAGALDLGSAADIASNVLTGFRLNVDQTSRVVAVLALQANRSNTNVQQLGEAMKFAAPIAAGLGVTVEESASAIGALSDSGLQASLAGTGLRKSLLDLQKPTSTGQKVLKRYGLSLDDVDIKSKGLIPVLETLKKANIDITDAVEIAGTRGGPALSILVDSFDKVRDGAIRAREEATGFDQATADIMDDNLNGAFLALNSALQDFVLEIGSLGADSGLTRFVKALTEGVRALTKELDRLIPALITLGITIAGIKLAVFVKSLSLAAGGAGVLATAIGYVTGAVRALTIAMLANPIGLFIGLLGAAATAFILFSEKAKTAEDRMNDLSAAVKTSKEELSQLGAVGLDLRIAENASEVNTLKGELDAIIARRKELNKQAEAANNFNTFTVVNKGAEIKSGKLLKEELELKNRIKIVEQDTALAKAALNKEILRGSEIGKEAEKVQTASQKSAAAFVEETLADLQKENMLLGLNNIERGVQADLLTILNNAEGENATLTTGQAGKIEAALRYTASLKAQAEILDELNGPTEELRVREAALNALREKGAISQEQLTTKLKEYRDELNKVGLFMDNLASKQEEEIRLLGMSASARAIESKWISIVNSAKNAGATDAEIEKIKAETISRLEVIESMKKQNAMLESINSASTNYATSLTTLNQLLSSNAITTAQYNDKLTEINLTWLDTQNTLEAGVARGFIRVQESMRDVASLAEDQVVSAFNKAEGALEKFIRTGEFNLKGFLQEMSADLAVFFGKLAFRNLLFGDGQGGGPNLFGKLGLDKLFTDLAKAKSGAAETPSGQIQQGSATGSELLRAGVVSGAIEGRAILSGGVSSAGKTTASGLTTSFVQGNKELKGTLSTCFPDGAEVLKGGITESMETAGGGFLSSLGTVFTDAGTSLFDTLKGVFSGGADLLSSIFGGGAGGGGGFLSSLTGLFSGGGASAGGGAAGGGGLLSSLTGFIGGAAGPAAAAFAGPSGPIISAGIQGLLGFEKGGDFMVGGQGGPDSQLVAFKASPNEKVSVQTPQQQSSGESYSNPPPVSVNNHILFDPEAMRAVTQSQGFVNDMLDAIEVNGEEIKQRLNF